LEVENIQKIMFENKIQEATVGSREGKKKKGLPDKGSKEKPIL
jgi:hypothetical protein